MTAEKMATSSAWKHWLPLGSRPWTTATAERARKKGRLQMVMPSTRWGVSSSSPHRSIILRLPRG